MEAAMTCGTVDWAAYAASSADVDVPLGAKPRGYIDIMYDKAVI